MVFDLKPSNCDYKRSQKGFSLEFSLELFILNFSKLFVLFVAGLRVSKMHKPTIRSAMKVL